MSSAPATMGADIAGWCVASGMEVTLQDVERRSRSPRASRRRGKLFARKFKTKAAARRGEGAPDRRPRPAPASAAPTSSSRRSSRSSRSSRTLFKDDRGQAQARRGAGDQHLLAHDRGYRRAARRSGPPHRHPLLQSCGTDAAGRGRARAQPSRDEEVKQGRRVRHRDRQVPADRQERARASSSTACWRPT